MWKIFFEYSDGSKINISGKQKDIPLHIAQHYQRTCGGNATKGIYQQYPKKKHAAMKLKDKIAELDCNLNVGDRRETVHTSNIMQRFMRRL